MTDKASRRLTTYVHVDGRRYGPEDGDIPAEVAAKITNPKVWAGDDDESQASVSGGSNLRRSGPRLASYVHVGGKRYGPDDPIPDDVARRITNPNAWEGGRLPDGAANDGGSTSEGATGEGDSGGSGGEQPAPPRSGPGSSQEAWQEWAAGRPDLGVAAGAKKADIMAAAENAGLIDKK